MKINFSTTKYSLSSGNRTNKAFINQSSHYSFLQKSDTFSFTGKTSNEKITKEDYQNAVKYLNKRKSQLSTKKTLNFSKFDLDKLNGIQRGIKVFDGLSIREIAYVTKNLYTIAVNRGCHNNCSYCYVSALPPHLQQGNDIINKMDWDDFKSFTSGIKELDKRLGFKSIQSKDPIGLFHDSDSIELEITDNRGKKRDFIDMNNLLYKSTGTVGIFDTAGWTPKNIEHQKRAEKIVKYYSNDKNISSVSQVAISINPFHGINAKAIENKNKGNYETAQKLRNFYTDRMANVLFTFTPMLEKPKFRIMMRALSDVEGQREGYKVKDLNELNREILKKLKLLYKNDLATDRKYVKTTKELEEKIVKYSSKLRKSLIETNVVVAGRGKDIYDIADERTERAEFVKRGVKYLKTEKRMEKFFNRYIDANGKVYTIDLYSIIPTELQLNFKNKNKKTFPIGEEVKDFTITREMIEKS